jgi:hypothetical protein
MAKRAGRTQARGLARLCAVALIGLGLCLPHQGHAAQGLPLRWITTHDAALRLMPELTFEDSPTLTIVPSDDLDLKAPPLVILAGIALLPSIANALIVAYRNLLYGGIIVEMEGDHLVIRTDRRLPYGTLIVRDGEVSVYRVDELPDSAELMAGISELAKRAVK